MSTVVDDPVIEPEPTDETEPAADGGSQASSDRKFPVRRISFFDDDAADVPHLYMDGDIVMSHIVAALSSLFPEGEDYFVRSVRHYRDQITDPVLKKQVAGFIGQEAIHGREHRAFNDRLDELGFPTKAMDRFTAKRLKFNERVAPPKVRLAVTAALEHYTATLAEVLLGDEEAQAMFTEPEVRHLLMWHAIEESEPHLMRHTYASAVPAVSRLLGHQSESVTLDVYSHMWPGDDDRAREALASMFVRPGEVAEAL